MFDTTPTWSAYARLQQISRSRASAVAYDWGIEEALDHILEVTAGNDEVSPADVDRVISTARAREGHRARLRMRYIHDAAAYDPTAMIEARARIRDVFSGLSRLDAVILFGAGRGECNEEIAAAAELSAGAARVRLARIRKRIAV